MPNLIGNLLFEYFDRFQAYSSSVCEKVESQFFLEKEFLQIKWVSFYNLDVFFMSNLICPLLSFMFNFIHSNSTSWYKKQPQKRRLVALI